MKNAYPNRTLIHLAQLLFHWKRYVMLNPWNKAYLTAIALALIGFALYAAAQDQNFSHNVSNGTITITKYTGSDGAVTIPNSINGLQVTRIGETAFYCSTLKSITMGSNVTSIVDGAFDYCTNLTSITVDVNNRTYSSLDGVLFDKNQTTIIQCPPGKAGHYTIPISVTSIGRAAFSGCRNLTSIVIPDRVTNIGVYAFELCHGLTNVVIGNKVTTIQNKAFYECKNLKNITIPKSVTSIGDEAFIYCANLEAVYCLGNTPLDGSGVGVFFRANKGATVYYLPGTTGWKTTFGGRPTALFSPMPAPIKHLENTNSDGF